MFKLVAPRYPLFVPVDPSKPKPKFREWGRTNDRVITIGLASGPRKSVPTSEAYYKEQFGDRE